MDGDLLCLCFEMEGQLPDPLDIVEKTNSGRDECLLRQVSGKECSVRDVFDLMGPGHSQREVSAVDNKRGQQVVIGRTSEGAFVRLEIEAKRCRTVVIKPLKLDQRECLRRARVNDRFDKVQRPIKWCQPNAQRGRQVASRRDQGDPNRPCAGTLSRGNSDWMS